MLGSWVRAPASSRRQPPFWGGCFVLYGIVEHWGRLPISFVMFINLYEHNSHITKLLRTINRATMLCPQHNSAVPSHLIAGCEDNWIIAHFVAPLVSSLRLRRSSPSEFTRRQSSDCRLFFCICGHLSALSAMMLCDFEPRRHSKPHTPIPYLHNRLGDKILLFWFV